MKKKTITRTFIAGAATLALGASVLPFTGAFAEADVDGLSSATAAASCWEIKQNDPSSASGTYWLYTPAMEAPAQFYCDQETDGGGWVLIGRGREGWTEDYAGKGNASELYKNPDGTDAFSPVQLSSETVDQLLNNEDPSALKDGVRFRRASNTNGTSWQEVRANRDKITDWSWALRANAYWSNVSFSGGNTNSSNSSSLESAVGNISALNSGANSIAFSTSQTLNWYLGFTYGKQVSGNSSATSYLWSPSGPWPIAFTQVYLRPQLTQQNVGFTSIADEGLSGESKVQVPNSYSAAMKWRTSTETGTGNTGELNTQVQAITQVGNTVFTGGDFKNLVSANGEIIAQSFLAGFDVNTAELNRYFHPTFNGQIKALEGLSNGKLAVGGEFTQVNGEDVAGFVVLDPTTGQIDHTYDWLVENRLPGAATVVKTIQESNGYLYIGGAFTHLKGATSPYYVYARSAARFSMNDGSVDSTWTPNFNGTVNGISAAADGSAVYAAGYFTTNKGETSWKLAKLDPTTGALTQKWNWKLSYSSTADTRAGFQFDVQDAVSSVWTGGAEHLIAQYNPSTLQRLSSSVTRSGGDFQDLYLDAENKIVYGACHCGDWVYEGGDTHNDPWVAGANVHRIRLVGAFDATTGKVIPTFNPTMSSPTGYGVWESFKDSTGVMWFGGDITKSLGANSVQNTVGFVRYTPSDVTPAAAPTNLQVATDGVKDTLTWTSGTAAPTEYQILRNDRVIATVEAGTTSYSVDHKDGARYFVRSVDAAGNYSATTPVALVAQTEIVTPTLAPSAEPTTEVPTEDPTQEPTTEPIEEPTEVPVTEAPVEEPVVENAEVIAMGSTWDYGTNAFNVSSTWKNVDTAVTGWRNATAPIGWGATNLATTLAGNSWRQPISMYVRKDFTVENPTAYSNLVLNVRSDDGTVIYLNGKEVKRNNIANGTVYAYTYASTQRSDADAQNNLIQVVVPASSLNSGKNTIAVSVHGQSTFYASVSFDLSATLEK